MGRLPYTDEDLERALARTRRALAKHGRASMPEDPRRNTCQFVLTTAHNSNGKKIHVRCRCMAPYRAAERFYGYDYVAVVPTFVEALAAWREHRREVLDAREHETLSLLP